MKLKNIGLIGQGNFGKLLYSLLPRVFEDVEIVVYSRNGRISLEEAASCDLVIPAVSIDAFEDVIRNIKPFLQAKTIVMDVCSVKIFPVAIMKKYLPPDTQIIASHPMFGPGTISKLGGNLKSLRIVMENISSEVGLYDYIKNQFMKSELQVIEMKADVHDKFAADFHFSAHFMAAIVKKINLSRSPIDTRSVESLFDFVEMVQTDSPSLLREMYRYNPYCKEQLKKIIQAQNSIISYLQTT